MDLADLISLTGTSSTPAASLVLKLEITSSISFSCTGSKKIDLKVRFPQNNFGKSSISLEIFQAICDLCYKNID